MDFQNNNSTAKKFVRYFFIVLVVSTPLVFFVYHVLNSSSETQQAQISSQLNLDAEFLIERLNQEVEELIYDLEILSSPDKKLVKVQNDLENLLQRIPAIVHINYFTPDGNVKYSSSPTKLHWQSNLLNKSWYRQLIRTWKPILSSIYQSPISPFPQVISLAVPVNIDDQIDGFWLVYLDVNKIDPIFPMMKNPGLGKYTIWFDGSGEILNNNFDAIEKINNEKIANQRWWYQINENDQQSNNYPELQYTEGPETSTYFYGVSESRYSNIQAIVIQNSVKALSSLKSVQSDLILIAVLIEIILLVVTAVFLSMWEKRKDQYAIIENQAGNLQSVNQLLETKTEDLTDTNNKMDRITAQLEERKDDLLVLNDRLRRLHKYLNFLTVPVVAIDDELKIEFVNHVSETELGLASRKVKGKLIHDCLNIENSDQFQQLLQKIKKDQNRNEYEISLEVDQQKKKYLMASDYLILNDWQGYIMTFTDLTDLLNLQNKIKAKNRFLDTSAQLMQTFLHIGNGEPVLKSSLDAIKSYSKAHSVYCYQGEGDKLILMEQLSDKRKTAPKELQINSSMAGSTMLVGQVMIIQEKDSVPQNYESAENQWQFKSAIFKPLVVNRKAKGVLIILDPSSEMSSAYDKYLAPLLVNFEIGFAALLSHEELKDSAAYRAHLLRSTTHGLNTPLSTIKGYIKLMNLNCKSEIDKYPIFRKYLEKLGYAADDMEEKVKVYLDMARLNRGELSLETDRMTINEFLSPLKSQLFDEASFRSVKLSIKDEIDAKKEIMTDEKRYSFALRTVLLNALRFAPAGDEVKVDISTDNGHLRMTIEDHRKPVENKRAPFLESDIPVSGLTPQQIHDSDYLAMVLAVKLVRFAQGDLEISSTKSGTVHKINLPLNMQDKNETHI